MNLLPHRARRIAAGARQAAALFLFAVLALAPAGCRLGQPASASFASVVIHGRTAEEIQTATGQVFREDGYAGGVSGPGQMIFDKEGTRGQNFAREGLVRTHYGAQTQVRARLEIVELGGDSRRLQCQVFMVSSSGDTFFEDETRLANFRAGPYQDLLDEVKKRLTP